MVSEELYSELANQLTYVVAILAVQLADRCSKRQSGSHLFRSDFYEVMQIEGKGLGCVATKDIKRGTLILREKAQIFKYSEFGNPDWVKSVETSFKQMRKNNQECLYNSRDTPPCIIKT